MLALDDVEWSRLSHAYGPASDTPKLLTDLAHSPGPKADYRSEPWFSLWSSLCHQGDVYTASYAALPHVVEIADTADGTIAFDFFALPAAIEVARQNGRGPAIPDHLADAYHAAIARLMDSVFRHKDDPWDEPTLLSAIAAQAISKGHADVAEAIINLDSDIIAKLRNGEFGFRMIA